MDIQTSVAKAVTNVARTQVSARVQHDQNEQPNQKPQKTAIHREGQPRDLDHTIESMNDLLETTPTSIKFNLHEDLDRIFVQVVDLQTKEVLKEIPPEEFLDMVASMLKNAGLIVDERI